MLFPTQFTDHNIISGNSSPLMQWYWFSPYGPVLLRPINDLQNACWLWGKTNLTLWVVNSFLSWPLTRVTSVFTHSYWCIDQKIDYGCTSRRCKPAAAQQVMGARSQTQRSKCDKMRLCASCGMDVLFKLSSACNSLENLWGDFAQSPLPTTHPPRYLSLSLSLSACISDMS